MSSCYLTQEDIFNKKEKRKEKLHKIKLHSILGQFFLLRVESVVNTHQVGQAEMTFFACSFVKNLFTCVSG